MDYSGSTLSTDWDALGEGASQTYTMFVDKTAPTLTDITLSEDLINDGRVMTVTASDNRYVAAAVLYDYSTGKILARTGGFSEGSKPRRGCYHVVGCKRNSKCSASAAAGI